MGGLGLGLGLSRAASSAAAGEFNPRNFLSPSDEGFGIDFRTAKMVVQDQSVPSNDFVGDIANKLTITGLMPPSPDGGVFTSTNFARILESAWPYSNTRITMAGEVKFDAAIDPNFRVVFQIDPGGNDRLQLCVLANTDDLTLSAGLGGSAVNLSADNVIASGVWRKFVVVAGPAGMFMVVDNTVRSSATHVLAASDTAGVHHGIGASTAVSGGAATANYMNGNFRSLVVLNRPVSKEVAKAGWPFGLSLVAVGDSITHGVVADVTQAESYPALLNDRIGRIVNSINAGVQGDSTAEMMSRRADIAADGTPDIVILYGGTNDVSTAGTVQEAPTPTSTVFAIEAGKGGYYKTDGWITVGAEQAQIASVAGDTITLKSALVAGAPVAGTVVAIDTQKNLTELALYAQSIGCSKILIPGIHYWNWTSGGDTIDVQLPRNATLRTKQQAAAAAAGAIYVDLYGWMRQLIIDGDYIQGGNAWHSSPNNQHLNEEGQRILADAIESAMRSEGWI